MLFFKGFVVFTILYATCFNICSFANQTPTIIYKYTSQHTNYIKHNKLTQTNQDFCFSTVWNVGIQGCFAKCKINKPPFSSSISCNGKTNNNNNCSITTNFNCDNYRSYIESTSDCTLYGGNSACLVTLCESRNNPSIKCYNFLWLSQNLVLTNVTANIDYCYDNATITCLNKPVLPLWKFTCKAKALCCKKSSKNNTNDVCKQYEIFNDILPPEPLSTIQNATLIRKCSIDKNSAKITCLMKTCVKGNLCYSN